MAANSCHSARKSHAMLSDPQSVTVNAVAKSLPQVDVGGRKGVYYNATDGLRLTVSHSTVSGGSRERHTVRLDSTKTAADPLLDGVSRQYSMSSYLVIDRPAVGFSPTEAGQVAQAIIDWLDTPANLSKVIGGES